MHLPVNGCLIIECIVDVWYNLEVSLCVPLSVSVQLL